MGKEGKIPGEEAQYLRIKWIFTSVYESENR